MLKHFKQIFFIALAAVLILMGTTSCGTMRGFGEDVGRAGNQIERAANQ